ncbi:unnamed protein product [Danaus chrysippus]|uniref:(African queen) hypothetical protein n=1 Tax=Danaus chrysippus TaxID=151541 RepID=A0A8J2QCM2_9NEOP|nr:unnamed protein product [Danaus chrysippus]
MTFMVERAAMRTPEVDTRDAAVGVKQISLETLLESRLCVSWQQVVRPVGQPVDQPVEQTVSLPRSPSSLLHPSPPSISPSASH